MEKGYYTKHFNIAEDGRGLCGDVDIKYKKKKHNII